MSQISGSEWNIHGKERAVCLFVPELKRAKTEGTKYHAKTMMSTKADKTVEEKPRMCDLGRTRREKTREGVKNSVFIYNWIKKGESRG